MSNKKGKVALPTKFDSQALLIFIKSYLQTAELKESKMNGNKVLKIKGTYQPEGFVSKITYPKRTRNITKNFFNLENYKLSSLVPKIWLYKVTSKGVYQPFYFPTDTKIDKPSSQKPFGTNTVGIKSFQVDFVGQDTYTAKKFLDCKLSLYVDNLEDIFKEPDIGSDYARLADLFTISRAAQNKTIKGVGNKSVPQSQIFNASRYEIGAVIGWTGGLNVLKDSELSDIEETKLVLRMTLSDHTINVAQDGSATIDVSYTARMIETLNTRFFDIAASPATVAQQSAILDNEEELARGLDDPSAVKIALEEIKKRKKALFYAGFRDGIFEPLKKQGRRHSFAGNKYLEQYYGIGKKENELIEGLPDKVKEIAKKEQGKKELPPPKKPAGNSDKKDDPLKLKLEQLRHPSNKIISYINYGDFLEQIFTYARENLNSGMGVIDASSVSDNIKKKRKKVLQEKIAEIDATKILLADVTIPLKSETPSTINIADIPISVKTYSTFFFNKLTNQNKHTFNLSDVLKLSVTSLLPAALKKFSIGNASFLDSDVNFSYISLAGDKLKTKSSEIDIGKLPSFLRRRGLRTKQQEMEYFIIYTTPTKKNGYMGKGSAKEDKKSGIYHFHLSKDRGLIKSIDFSKFDVPFRKEGLMVDSVSLYDELKMPYSANITMFGNTLFFPGSQIYISPKSIGFGDPRNKKSAAFRLGLGGYYTVLKVSHSINGGDFTTNLECSFGSWKAARGGGLLGAMAAEELGILE